MYTETHAKFVKTSCFSISMTDAFQLVPYGHRLPYSYKTIGFLVQNSYTGPAVQNRFLLSVTPFHVKVKETKI